MIKRPWVKLWRKMPNDEKIAYLVRRHGHDCMTVWICLLTRADDDTGEVDLEERELFADFCCVAPDRLEEILGLFVRLKMVHFYEESAEIVNWTEYQAGESTERSRVFRERRRESRAEEEDAASAAEDTSSKKPDKAEEAPVEEEKPQDCGHTAERQRPYNGEATTGQRDGNGHATAGQRDGNGDAAAMQRPREREREKEKEDPYGSGGPPAPVLVRAGPQSEDAELYAKVRDVFLSRNDGKFTNWGKEGRAVKELIRKARARARDPTEAEAFLGAMIGRFWELKTRGSDKFYRGQPFVPSALNAAGIWDRVLETFRAEEMNPEEESIVREVYGM